MELLARLTAARIPVIINIHNVELAKRFAHRIIGMAGGRIVFDGAPEALDHHLKTRSMAARIGCERDVAGAPCGTGALKPTGGAHRLGLAALRVYALFQLDITWARLRRPRQAGRFLASMFPPNFMRWELLLEGLAESDADRGAGLGLGILLAADRPPGGAQPDAGLDQCAHARLVIALCRSCTTVIVAILFVKAVGFGALAGVSALVIASIGFVAKLFAEAIEEISHEAGGGDPRDRRGARPVLSMACCRRWRRASSASPSTSSIPTCATRPWSASSARAASAARSSPRSSASTTISSAPSCSPSSQ
jgi:hypothetical protein